MKKSIFSLLFMLVAIYSWAQIVTTSPSFIDETTSNFTIYYNPATSASTTGCAGLSTLTSGVYAHIGAIISGTNSSTSDTDWKYVLTPWPSTSPNNYALANTTKNSLSYNPTTKLWALSISGNIREFLGITNPNEKVKKIALVFRNSTGSLTGKGSTNGSCSDIWINVGYNVSFTAPIADGVRNVGTELPITIVTNLASTIKLYANGTLVTSQNNVTTLSNTYTFSNSGDYQFIAEATAQNVTIRDTLNFCAVGDAIIESRPANDLPGIKYLSSTSVRLVLHAPNKSNVLVIGDMNNWIPKTSNLMKKDGEYWWIDFTGLTAGQIYRFQYLVDGSTRISDPYTEMALDPWNDKWINEKYNINPSIPDYPIGKTEDFVATFQTDKPAYNWEVPTFTMPSKDNMVIYELLLRDFTVERSLAAAIEKLDYLKNLGITAIELMPIQEFDGNNSWGYNPNHYFAPDKAYGNSDMYKKFIDECHKRGIAVILDIVLNHATGSHPFAKLYWNSASNQTASNNPWFNVTATHPYSVYHDFNHSYIGTREYFKRMVQYWINEYKIDGYRLDLTKGLTQTQSTESTASNYDQSRIDNITVYYDAAKAVKNDVFFILEHFCNNDEETALANKGMYLWRNVNNAFSQAAMGIQSNSDFGGLNSLPRRWVGYAESHDEERNFYKAKTYGDGVIKTDSIYRISRVPLNIAFTTLVPGPKMIWQFGEMGFDYSIDSQGGRTNPKPSTWGWLNLAHRKAAADASAKIITLRKMYPTVFNEGNFSMQAGSGDWENGKRISISHNDLNILVLGNFKASNNITAFPNFPKTGSWYNLLTGQLYSVGYVNTPIEVKAGEVLIFTDRQINFANGVNKTDTDNYSKVYPTTTSGRVIINTPNELNTVNVYNIQGSKIMSETNKSEINIAHLINGMYLIEVICNENKNTVKIIKK